MWSEQAFQEIFAPDGQLSEMDPTMLRSLWKEIFGVEFPADMGKPTFPLSHIVYETALEYINQNYKSHRAVDYGAPEGEPENRALVAEALSHTYAKTDKDEGVVISAKDVIFTVGGAGAISVLMEMLKTRDPDGKILLQEPWYPLYARDESALYPVNVMKEKGYRLTAALLARYINKAEQEGVHFRAVILCDPNNPMSTCIGRAELIKIARLLDERLPNVPVILDHAYCDFGLYGKHISLVQVASPALRNRIVMLHSATKAHSMAGERGALVVIFDDRLRRKFVDLHVTRCGHVPKMIQYIYARVLKYAEEHPEEQEAFIQYHRQRVEFVMQRAEQSGIRMPDPDYKPEGTFYVLVDLQDLMGEPMPAEAAKVFGSDIKTVQNSQHMAYKMLIETGISFAPLDDYTLRLKKGQRGSSFMRITCSADLETLRAMMDRLEEYILSIRQRSSVAS